MPVTGTLSNHFKYQLMKKAIDLDADELRVILMKDTFTFDKDTHAVYTDVSGEEIPQAHGYISRGIELLSGELTEDDTNDKGAYSWGSNSTWTASGGSIGPVGAAIIFDETSSDDTVAGCIDFGEDYTISEGLSIQVMSGEISLT